nr:hypothetical protein [Pandoravirus belohorizontensis]
MAWKKRGTQTKRSASPCAAVADRMLKKSEDWPIVFSSTRGDRGLLGAGVFRAASLAWKRARSAASRLFLVLYRSLDLCPPPTPPILFVLSLVHPHVHHADVSVHRTLPRALRPIALDLAADSLRPARHRSGDVRGCDRTHDTPAGSMRRPRATPTHQRLFVPRADRATAARHCRRSVFLGKKRRKKKDIFHKKTKNTKKETQNNRYARCACLILRTLPFFVSLGLLLPVAMPTRP